MKKILLAEDDDNLREIICETLSAEGYTVTAVADGESALAELKEQADLFISEPLKLVIARPIIIIISPVIGGWLQLLL